MAVSGDQYKSIQSDSNVPPPMECAGSGTLLVSTGTRQCPLSCGLRSSSSTNWKQRTLRKTAVSYVGGSTRARASLSRLSVATILDEGYVYVINNTFCHALFRCFVFTRGLRSSDIASSEEPVSCALSSSIVRIASGTFSSLSFDIRLPLASDSP